MAHEPQEHDDHHIIPTSRVKNHRGYRSKKGLNAPWNIRSLPAGQHRSYHYLFANKTPDEIVAELRKRTRKRSGMVSFLFFFHHWPSVVLARMTAWIALFGNSFSAKRAIETIEQEWALSENGKKQWELLQQRMQEHGDSVLPPAR